MWVVTAIGWRTENAMSADTPGATLHRVVGLWGAVWMGLGSILGTGVFVSLGIAAGVVGPGVLLAVALAALVATANGLSSAQLAAAHPVSGGTYEYGYRFVHPWAGFSAGWMYLAAKSASAATAALGCAAYALHVVGNPDWARGVRVPLAIGLVVVLTALTASGLRRSNLVNIVIVSLTLATLIVFVSVGWSHVDVTQLPDNLGWTSLSTTVRSPSALLHATALMFVAYTGYGRIATLGEEVVDPARTIPRAIIVTLVVSMVIYLSVAATAVAVVGAESFADATGQQAAPLEAVASAFSQPWVASVVAVGAVTAMAGVLLNLILGLSRVLLALARRRDMPAALDVVSRRTQSPTRAVWVMGGVIAGLALLGDIRLTWTFSAFTVLVYYGLTNLSALFLPRESRRFPRWISVAGLVSCLGLAFFVPWRVWMMGVAVLVVGCVWRAAMQWLHRS
ncbi:MAG: APA family basic amino acid/polyamine antiporter [Myxococcota bacterium]